MCEPCVVCCDDQSFRPFFLQFSCSAKIMIIMISFSQESLILHEYKLDPPTFVRLKKVFFLVFYSNNMQNIYFYQLVSQSVSQSVSQKPTFFNIIMYKLDPPTFVRLKKVFSSFFLTQIICKIIYLIRE